MTTIFPLKIAVRIYRSGVIISTLLQRIGAEWRIARYDRSYSWLETLEFIDSVERISQCYNAPIQSVSVRTQGAR